MRNDILNLHIFQMNFLIIFYLIVFCLIAAVSFFLSKIYFNSIKFPLIVETQDLEGVSGAETKLTIKQLKKKFKEMDLFI